MNKIIGPASGDLGRGDRTVYGIAEIRDHIDREIAKTLCMSPRVLYSRFKPYLIVDNTGLRP